MIATQQPMTDKIVSAYTAELMADTGAPADRNPAFIYLATLSEGSRRFVLNAIGVIACLLTGKEPSETTEQVRDELGVTLNCGMLRAQHVVAVRTALAGRYHFKTANKTLTAHPGRRRAFYTARSAAFVCRRSIQRGSRHSQGTTSDGTRQPADYGW